MEGGYLRGSAAAGPVVDRRVDPHGYARWRPCVTMSIATSTASASRRIRPAMGLHHHAVQPDQGSRRCSAADPSIRAAGPAPGAPAGSAQPRGNRRREDLPKRVAHQLQRALPGLERDIAGEAVRHDHIGGAGDVVALDEAAEIGADMQIAQRLGRGRTRSSRSIPRTPHSAARWSGWSGRARRARRRRP